MPIYSRFFYSFIPLSGRRAIFFVAALIVLFSTLHATLPTLPSSLETLTIQEGGRRKPYFVFAEESLRSLSGSSLFGKTGVQLDGKSFTATEVITSFWLEPTIDWASKPMILVSHQPLKEALGLDLRRKLFSYEELVHNEKLQKIISEASAERRRDAQKRLEGLAKEASDVGMRLALFEELAKGSIFCIVPNAERVSGKWASLADWKSMDDSEEAIAASDDFSAMQAAWTSGDAAAFSQAVSRLCSVLECLVQPDSVPTWKLKLEVFYQKAHPFRWAWIFYALSGILLMLFSSVQKNEGRNFWKRFGYRTAWFCAGSGFLLQLLGLISRVLVAGRPPVTNMYEVVIWVAFGVILFALIFETIYHAGTFLLGAVPVAVASLILADSQPMILDQSIRPLMPVLRDNFWLSTHVLMITLSYAAFALSLGVAHVILLRGIFQKKVTATLYNYLYRSMQVGVLLLATGVILGGVWANYSWGRFWDWDPKETWALTALLGYLFLLHGRIAGRWGGFGLAVGAVFAFLGILMASYGVNFILGSGLHSYGFGTGGYPIVLGFIGLEIAVVTAAIICDRKQRKKK
ncbi:MAG: cytochrome c biogenesis protein [Chthoniobacterales bacterium]